MSTNRRSKGRIRKLPSGKYQAGYVGPDAVIHYASSTFTSKVDAEGWISKEFRLIERGEWTSPAARQAAKYSDQVTVAEYAKEWIASRDLRDSTRRSYEISLRTAIEGTSIAGIPVKALTRQQVTAWWRAMDRKTPRARSKAYGLLRFVMNGAVEDELIEFSPAKVTDRKAVVSSTERRLVPIEPEALDKLEAGMPDRLKLAVSLAAWGGLRYGELMALRRCDVDLRGDYPVLHVSRSVTFLSGSKPVAGPPKTEAGIRDVILPSWLKSDIAQHLLAHAQAGKEGLVFPSPEGLFLWPAGFHKYWKRAREAAGVADLRVHDLRHHAAVRAAQAGETFSAVQARLGHSSAKAALRYQHAAANSDQRIAEALDKMRDAR